jgi:GT2 family glycosyltransferase
MFDKCILLVAINYNSPNETINFVESLSKLYRCQELQLVIVENSDNDQRDTKLYNNCKQYLSDIIFVETPMNLNYFGSANFGIRELGLNPISYKYFIISNVDMLIDDISFFDKLLPMKVKNIGIIAPAVISTAQGLDQNPYMKSRFKKALFYYYFIIRQHVILTTVHEKFTDFIKGLKASKTNLKKSRGIIYAPHGAFLIFTRSYFELGGSIDFGSNLFGEEIFVAEECRKNNLNVYYEPSIRVLHAEHVSTGSASTKFVVEKKKQSVIYFLKNYK